MSPRKNLQKHKQTTLLLFRPAIYIVTQVGFNFGILFGSGEKLINVQSGSKTAKKGEKVKRKSFKKMMLLNVL